MSNILITVVSIFGLIIGAVVVYNLLAHGDATIGILKAAGNFVTTETSVLEGR